MTTGAGMDKVTLALVKSKANAATSDNEQFPIPSFLKTDDNQLTEEARERQKKKLEQNQRKRNLEREKNRQKYRMKYGLEENKTKNNKNAAACENARDFGGVSSDISRSEQQSTKCFIM